MMASNSEIPYKVLGLKSCATTCHITILIIKFFFKKVKFSVYGCLAYMYVCVLSAYVLLAEVKGRYWILWS